MKISRINREKMTKRRLIGSDYPLVYICSPYAALTMHGVRKNIAAARSFCRYAIDHGCNPVASHLLHPQYLNDDDPKEREMGLEFGKALLAHCSEVWVFGKISKGMKAEIEYAKRLRIPVKIINDERAYGNPPWNPLKPTEDGGQ